MTRMVLLSLRLLLVPNPLEPLYLGVSWMGVGSSNGPWSTSASVSKSESLMPISAFGGRLSHGGSTKLGFRLMDCGVGGEGPPLLLLDVVFEEIALGGVMDALGEGLGECLAGDTRKVFLEDGLRGMSG